MKQSLHLLTLCLLLASFTARTHGASVAYQATGNFTSSDFTADIAVGDQFTIYFGYDDSITDHLENDMSGSFLGALHSFDFRLISGSSTGQYAGGYLTMPGEVQTFDGSGPVPDRFYARVDTGVFPQLGGHEFGFLLFVLDDPTHTSGITDPGGSPTLASVLNGTLDLSRFSQTTVRISATDKNGMAEGVVTSLTLIPEPTSTVLFSLAALALTLLRGRGRSN